jgi:hypothetical protein
VYQNPLVLTTPSGTLVLSHRPIPEGEIRDLLPRKDRPWINVHGHIHNSISEWATGPKYVNACVEMHNYCPIKLAMLGGSMKSMRKASTTTVSETVSFMYHGSDESAGFKSGLGYNLVLNYNKSGDYIVADCPSKGIRKTYTSIKSFMNDWRT